MHTITGCSTTNAVESDGVAWKGYADVVDAYCEELIGVPRQAHLPSADGDADARGIA